MLTSLQDLIGEETSTTQGELRLPGLTIAVAVPGVPPIHSRSGLADVASSSPIEPSTQFRLGSITKTFTAALTLLLAQRQVLDLDRTVETYLPGTPVGRPLLRQVLAHCGGLQREAPVRMWATMQGPDVEEFLACLDDAEQVSPPGERWHYSNLGYAILGEIIRRTMGRACADLIDDELIGPLGLTATTWQPQPGAATGYRLDPYTSAMHQEPIMDQGVIGVGGQLWSTAPDLLSWGQALIGAAPGVLPPAVTAAMHTPQVMVDRDSWSIGWGLGLILDRKEGRIQSGHTGAMPGYLSALRMDPGTGTVVAVLANVTRGIQAATVADRILTVAREYAPPAVVAAAPGTTGDVPERLAGVLGNWWSESEETVFEWRSGALHAHLSDDASAVDTTFVQLGTDLYRAQQGRFDGERLVIVRAGDGAVAGLEWATYPYTREPS